MNGKNPELVPTNIKSENDALRHSLHLTRQNLCSRESPPSTLPTGGEGEKTKACNKRRVRRRASEPINIPCPPQRSPYTVSSDSDEGEEFLYRREVQAWDDSMVTASYHTRESVSLSIETRHSHYAPLRNTLPLLMASPGTCHLKSLPSDELRRRGPLLSKEKLFAEEDSMKEVCMEREKPLGWGNGKEGTAHKRPDTPMTTLLMKITEL